MVIKIINNVAIISLHFFSFSSPCLNYASGSSFATDERGVRGVGGVGGACSPPGLR